MRTILVYKGLPGCGKSTEAKKLLKKEPDRWKRVNRDDIRNMVDDGFFSKENEDFVSIVSDAIVRKALADGYDVILDNTHLSPQSLKKIHNLAEGVGDVQVVEKAFNEPVSVCLERNAKREGKARVPDEVIHRMAKSSGIDKGKKLQDSVTYYLPRNNAAPNDSVVDESLPKAVLCDLDGTLAKIGNRSPYDASQCDIVDHPNWPVIQTVLLLYSAGVKIVFMSGRDSKYREPTIRFIERWCRLEHGLNASSATPSVNEVIEYELHMRGTGDMRKDSVVKEELYNENVRDKYNVLFTLDDRNQVVDFWRSIGLTCFQVADGAF